MEVIIVGKDCEKCRHSNIDYKNISMPTVYCDATKRTYIWGTCKPCDLMEKRDNNGK